MEHFVGLTLTAFSTLFPIVDPIGAMGLFAAMSEDLPPSIARRVALKASFFAFVVLLLFAFRASAVLVVALHTLFA